MNILGIDADSKHMSYVVMDRDHKLVCKGQVKIDELLEGLDGLIAKHNIVGIAVEEIHRWNEHSIREIELVGMLEMYCEIQKLLFWKYNRPKVWIGLTGTEWLTSEGMAGWLKDFLNLPNKLHPEAINSAACVAAYTVNRLKEGALSEN